MSRSRLYSSSRSSRIGQKPDKRYSHETALKRESTSPNRQGFILFKGSCGDYNFLKRYLARNVNRPWDKVYSNLLEVSKDPKWKHRFRSSVLNLVYFHTRVVDGLLHQTDSGRPWPLRNGDFYVDARTGLLRRFTKPVHKKAKLPQDFEIVTKPKSRYSSYYAYSVPEEKVEVFKIRVGNKEHLVQYFNNLWFFGEWRNTYYSCYWRRRKQMSAKEVRDYIPESLLFYIDSRK